MDGLLIVDKPKGFTSRDVVNKIEKILNTTKVGHGGTLDPLATGVLVIAVGTGLKILEYVNENDKEYIATVKLGIETNTLDITGEITNKKDCYFLNVVMLEEIMKSFIGKYQQTVPLYSSVKVNGQRLYKYARENIPVELPKREVEIFDIELLDSNQKEFTFKTTVSKGTYIRSLIKDIGDKLGIPCTMKELRRTRQGDFSLKDSLSLEDIEKGKIKIIPLDVVLKDYNIIEVDEFLEDKISNGALLDNRYNDDIIVFKNSKNDIIAIYEVYKKDNNKIKPVKIFKK